ncbi:hypothetical protein ACHQM5_021059 [Ranunculus cassubicifolius]
MEISSVFPGFRFSPTDGELISHYLRRKIHGSDSCGDVISEVELCKFEPWDLPEKSIIQSDHEWFFFSPNDKKYPNGSQAKRATEVGFWKATGKERDIKSGKNVIGTKRTLVFHLGRAPKGARTHWIMHEYCLKDGKDEKLQDSYVICRLRKKQDFTAKNQNSNSGDQMVNSHDSSNALDAPEVSSELQQQQQEMGNPGNPREGENDIMMSPVEDDCFADILNDDIVNLDDHQLFEPPPLPQQTSTVFKLTSPPCSFNSRMNHLQGTAHRRIRLEKIRVKRNKAKMAGTSGKTVDVAKDTSINCVVTYLTHRNFFMSNGRLILTVFVLSALTFFFRFVD